MKNMLAVSALSLLTLNAGSMKVAPSEKVPAASPVTWRYETKQLTDSTTEFDAIATIGKNDNGDNFHLYSKTTTFPGTEDRIALNFTSNSAVVPMGSLQEIGELITKPNSPMEGDTLRYYENSLKLVQVLKVKSVAPVSVKGSIRELACTEETCLPVRDVNFDVLLKSGPN